MKKALILGLTVLTITASCGPLTAQAAGKKAANQPVKKQTTSTCQSINNKLKPTGGKCKGNKKCPIFILNGNCSSIPGIGGGNGGNNNGNNNGNGGGTENGTQSSYAKQVVNLVNAERKKEGLSALTLDSSIEKAANVRAKEIQKSFSHTRPNGKGFSSVLKEAGVSFKGSGENIAYGQKTPKEVVDGWMKSPGHRANIMNKKFKKIGVGHQKNSKGTNYWVQLFTY